MNSFQGTRKIKGSSNFNPFRLFYFDKREEITESGARYKAGLMTGSNYLIKKSPDAQMQNK